MAAKSSEKATLSVGGGQFEDWESVWVQETWGDSHSSFKFTCAERDSGGVKKVKPGDECTIKLGGHLAITGEVLVREVAYDANQHRVLLAGVNRPWRAATSSIIHETHEFDDKTFEEIAKEILAPTGVKYIVKGNLPKTKFKYMSAIYGEPIWQFLNRMAIQLKIIIGNNRNGEFVFIGEGRDANSQGELIEGRNILKCNCVISMSEQRSKYMGGNQTAANDEKNGRKASEMEAEALGRYPRYRPLVTPLEQTNYEMETVKKRVDNEAMWTEAQMLKAVITVQGWQPGGSQGGGELWEVGKDVMVKSSMALLNQKLSIQQVTFEQNNQVGSISTLVLVAPWGLNGKNKFDPGDPGPPKPSQEAGAGVASQ